MQRFKKYFKLEAVRSAEAVWQELCGTLVAWLARHSPSLPLSSQAPLAAELALPLLVSDMPPASDEYLEYTADFVRPPPGHLFVVEDKHPSSGWRCTTLGYLLRTQIYIVRLVVVPNLAPHRARK